MTTTEEQSIEKHLQKHMGGCMAGFLQLFDRHHMTTTKRLYSAKTLPSPSSSSPATEMTTSESEKSMPPSPPPAVAESIPPKSPLPFSLLNSGTGAAKSTWKFGREAPRLSLDSRAVTDSKGCLHPKEIRTSITTNSNIINSAATTTTTEENLQHRSPSVIARLMGLEPLPPLTPSSSSTTGEPELRRSASESRATKEYLFYSRFEDFNSSNLLHAGGFKDNDKTSSSQTDPIRTTASSSSRSNIIKLQAAARFQQQQNRKCFFDSGDIFPEPKKTTSTASSHYGEEIENRLRMRGMNQPSKDLETLRQILEALQLKGLLHSRDQIGRRNFVYDESPTVVVKSPKSSAYSTPPINRRIGTCDYSPKSTKSQPRRRIAGEISPSVSPRRERNSPGRTGRSEINRRSNSLVKPRPLSVDTQRRASEAAENRRVSPIHSPKVNYSRRIGPDQTVGNNRSPRSKKPTTAEIYRKEKTSATVVEDESSSVSDCSYSTSTDTERSKSEEYCKDGRNLLERCGKLLHSIAEMTSTDLQPSPVSVLDSSFYKDESFTPSPVTTRRNIEFKDHSGELEDVEPWSPVISPKSEVEASQDSDYTYISGIVRASRYLPEQSDVFSLLEKQQYYLNGEGTIGKVSKLQRKLIFDVINEIIERNKRLPPWKATSSTTNDDSSIDKIWSEFRKLRDRNNAEDLFETICGVLKKDLAGDALNGWGDCYAEISDSILDIERMIFKDLISETIRDLAALSSRSIIESSPTFPRRKLIF